MSSSPTHRRWTGHRSRLAGRAAGRPIGLRGLALGLALWSCVARAGSGTAEGLALVETYQQELESVHRAQLPAGTDLHDLARGTAAIDARVAESQAAMADFPPWELFVADGAEAWRTPLPDGARYADCFGGVAVAAIRPGHPRFDEARAEVVTLDVAINDCRTAHGAQALPHGQGGMNALTGHLAHVAAGRAIDIPPPQSAAARAALADGRASFFARRGQLELSCADCHLHAVGRQLRDVTLGPAIGVVGRFPIYSLMAGMLGSLQARFQGCYRVTRATPEALQSRTYRNLEYYLNAVSTGYPVTGPGLLR